MARAAKKETLLTIEEKLAKALVPEEEQPYPVPENWCWVRLSRLSSVISKGTTPTGGKTAYLPTGIKFLRVENICDDGLISHDGIKYISESMHNTFLKRSQLQEGDVLISIAGTLGKTALVRDIDTPLNTNQAISFVRLKDGCCHPKFIKLCLDNPIINNSLLSQTKVTAIPNLTLEIIGKCPIPLPPLPEQQRIVTLIESLFADLDAAKEKLQGVLDGFAQRRAALLHQAFTGELTREWREENGIRDDSWVEKKLGDCGNWSGGGTPSMNHTEYWDDGAIRWVTSKDMKAEIINDTQMHITAMGEQNSSAKLINSCAVLFVTRSGILRRTLPIAMIRGKFTVNQDLKVLEPENNIDTKYLLRACQAREKKILDTCMKSGTTVESINFSALKTFVISVCSLSEQKEIVRILDDIFAKESQSKAAVESALAKIDTMKKAILATAFRGGFRTNDSSDESAVELLRKVL